MKHLGQRWIWIGCAMVAGLVLLLPRGVDSAVEWTEKVEPSLLRQLDKSGEAEFFVFLREQADLSGAAEIPVKADRGRFVFERLTETADRTQRPLLAELAVRGLEHRSFWAANMILVTGNTAAVAAFAGREDVARVYKNSISVLDRPVDMRPATSGTTRTPEFSLTQTGATDFWALGFTGQGTVVAGADTGYDWTHPALQGKYRGWDGASAVHDYNWHDSIHTGGGSCGADSTEPCDDSNHGTHTMGTMVGDDGGSNQIGMAPDAQWMGCRNMNQGFGSIASYTECFEFFIAPTDLNDENPDPGMAPDVINNSWGCAPSPLEDCDDPNALLPVVQNTRAAGITVVVSAGNSGSSCSSVEWPAAIYDESLTVGAVDSSDNIVGFSSRGPVTIDGSGRLKPDVSAPGSGIRSSVPGGGYASFSGTSMAGPHVAGLVALLISAEPTLAGNPTAIEDHVMASALPRTTTQTCGGIPGDQIPNNTYGFGSIRAVVPPPTTDIFTDGFESGDTSAWDNDVN